ncbi:MAG TPA: DUF72 domain-containing protein [Candidatus Dormibacteraeota bacterium]
MLSYYAERLNAVELNGTFYRTPPPGALATWAAQTPPGFRFCLKAARGLTYSAAAFPKVAVAAQVGQRLAEMGDRLGPVLLQWPPTARQPDPGLLDALLEALALPAAVEFRNPAWFVAPVTVVLRRRGAALVVTDEEKWPMAPVDQTAGFAYYRLRRDYSEAELQGWRRRLRALDSDVYVFFKHEPEAPARALALLTADTA